MLFKKMNSESFLFLFKKIIFLIMLLNNKFNSFSIVYIFKNLFLKDFGGIIKSIAQTVAELLHSMDEFSHANLMVHKKLSCFK